MAAAGHFGWLEQDVVGQQIAAQLLAHWTGLHPNQTSEEQQSPMRTWQKWFAEKYPDEIAAVWPVEAADSRWKYQELIDELKNDRKRSLI